jgi:2'-5' RNA ligase
MMVSVSGGESANGFQRVNCYAAVFYASGPLADFLDQLRGELEPGQPAPRSHVTVLPPRPLVAPTEEAAAQLQREAVWYSPFRAILGGIHSFEGTNVVYLSVAHGFNDLHRMHGKLNQGALHYEEPYPYHPHITLAQGLPAERMVEVIALARRRWEAYSGPRFFLCDSIYFVQATADGHWIDLSEVKLASEALAR